MYENEINFLLGKILCKLWKVSYVLVKTAMSFRNLQISQIISTNTNKTFPIFYKVMNKSLRCTKTILQ